MEANCQINVPAALTPHSPPGKRIPGTIRSRSCMGPSSGVPRNFVRGGGQQIKLRAEDRENGDVGGHSPLVRGSGGSCNLVQEISFHIVKFS